MGASRNWDTSGASTTSEFSVGSEGVAVEDISAADNEVVVPDVGCVASSVDSVGVGLGLSTGSVVLFMGVVASVMVVVVQVVNSDKRTAAAAYYFPLDHLRRTPMTVLHKRRKQRLCYAQF
jgi:hypothetical protein